MKSIGIELKKNKLISLFLVLGVSIGYIIFRFRDINVHAAVENLRQVEVRWLFIGMLVMCAYWFLEAMVLRRITRKVDSPQTVWESVKITMIGQFFNTITPFASGGQPAQLFLMKKNGISVGVGSSILLIKFIIFQSMLVLSSFIVLIFGFGYLQNNSIPKLSLLIMIGFILNTVVIITLVTIAKSKRVAFFIAHSALRPVSFFVKKERYELWKAKLDRKLLSFHEESNRMSFDLKLLFQCSLLTIAQLSLFLSIPFFIIQGLGIENVNLFQVIAFHAFIMMFSSLVPIPGGSGGAEYSFSLLFGLILQPTILILCLIFWRIITYYSCLIFGAFFFFAKRDEVNAHTLEQ
ncbi:lysylphosphatidylglycerol synthase transmembrane domain-containing protein [Marinilactibacillus sp. Marseille-P9653]|uniref:lysylphosphatidylglycerol synthase transmembrane domain-containing protein n=1 Tax=Marinilactibacillus sp. Marseille-P9653 TaxID=2866583 RepID=UPI001CE43C4D|nr:lysylphosphatidylglycerol synthase transmembrane domain-containing protein [Marinilactibacillus sp. Marseille-P9653]